MTLTDPIAEMITIIRNGLASQKQEVRVCNSKLKSQILEALKKYGFIEAFKVEGEKGKEMLNIKLRYDEAHPVISSIRRVSKPGRRVYISKLNIPTIKGGRGRVILSTSQGVLTDQEAKKIGVGGEAMIEVW
jgi:small subunit ribosomal protein S8